MTRVDLDELEQIAQSEDADVILTMIAELRAAREVLDRMPHSGILNAVGNASDSDVGDRQLWYDIANAMTAYREAVG